MAYIADMSSDAPKRARHRQHQARYEARQGERPPLSPGALRARRSRADRRNTDDWKRARHCRRQGDWPHVSEREWERVAENQIWKMPLLCVGDELLKEAPQFERRTLLPI
jgi:hypothetical protein